MARVSSPGLDPSAVAEAPLGAEPIVAAGRGSSYGQILKSSALIGGSSAFNLAFGILRSKAMALLLGPTGVGLIGLYMSILNLAQAIFGMGVGSSGVRQIAAAVGSGDLRSVASTAVALRRVSLALGLLGGGILIAASGLVSSLTFETAAYAIPVAVLSLGILFRLVADGQTALLQGMRRIGDIARIGVLGGLLGTLLTVLLVFFFREGGIVPSLVAVTASTLLFSWWYARRVALPAEGAHRWREETGGLLRLGTAFMASSMLIMGAAYVVRTMVAGTAGLAGAGLYQAAFTIGGLYVGFILQSMGTDFYPRLTAVINDHAECNRLVNEQTQVSALLAGPGVIATLTFAPLVVPLFYSGAFGAAVGTLRWICLGTALQVVSWPIGFIIVAQGRQVVFVAAEVAYTAAYLVLAWFLIRAAGVTGAGMAFLGSYAFHTALVYPVGRWLTGFAWSAATRQVAAVFLGLIGLVFVGFQVLPLLPAFLLGCAGLLASVAYSTRAIARLIPVDRLPRPIRTVLTLARLVPRPPGGGA